MLRRALETGPAAKAGFLPKAEVLQTTPFQLFGNRAGQLGRDGGRAFIKFKMNLFDMDFVSLIQTGIDVSNFTQRYTTCVVDLEIAGLVRMRALIQSS